MDAVLALALLAGLARIVGETGVRFFPPPARWKWALGWGLAVVVAYRAW
jgi:hypothetical protein